MTGGVSRHLGDVVDLDLHPIDKAEHVQACRTQFDATGVLLLQGFLTADAVAELVDEAEAQRHLAFHSDQTHNVYLDPPDPTLPSSDARSRAIVSTKGAVTTDLVPVESPLRVVYDSPSFRAFLCGVLGEAELHEYADPLSSINVNFYDPGQELGWHFDNSSFSVTLLVQEPTGGGTFEFLSNMRDTAAGSNNEQAVAHFLDGHGERKPVQLNQGAGDLVLFRGRDALHHVAPVEGDRTRLLVVFAYNTEPGLSLSENARKTFFGRLN